MLPTYLKTRIQGIAGEEIALEYTLERISTEPGDEILYVASRKEKLFSTRYRSKVKIRHIMHESPKDFFKETFIRSFLRIGFHDIDLKEADKLTRDLFKKYSSKTKKQILTELKRLFTIIEKKEDTDEAKEMREYLGNKQKERNKKMLDACKRLSKEDLVKAFAIAKADYMSQHKEGGVYEYLHPVLELFTYREKYDPESRHRADLPLNVKELSETMSKYVNAKFDDLFILSSLARLVSQSNTRLDAVIAHLSHEKLLKKIILLEVKTSKSGKMPPLTPNQKSFAESFKKTKLKKAEYKIIYINFKMADQVDVTELSYDAFRELRGRR